MEELIKKLIETFTTQATSQLDFSAPAEFKAGIHTVIGYIDQLQFEILGYKSIWVTVLIVLMGIVFIKRLANGLLSLILSLTSIYVLILSSKYFLAYLEGTSNLELALKYLVVGVAIGWLSGLFNRTAGY